jgi:L-alanine-DL-glutamate epimerase-like enolase superfamily enzyme
MSEIEVTAVDVRVLEGPRPWAFVFVETDAGVTGIGEVPVTRHTAADIERIGERLVGEDPFETERLLGADGELGAQANDIFTTTITGGLDMACWDIKGKHLGVPVHELLGGKIRDEVRVYANGWDFAAREVVQRYHDGEDADAVLADARATIADAAREVESRGYTALKFSPFQWGDGPTTSRLELDNALAVVEAVYDAVGDDVELLIEGHQNLSTAKAVTAARRLEKFDVGFYEEPVHADVEPLRRVARNSPVPVATGESFTTHHAFPELVSNTDVGVVQPDVGRAGGITELRKVAAMASAERVGFAPHNAAGPVMTHAGVHVDATTPSFAIQESFEEFYHPDWSENLVDGATIEDGTITVPDDPGLGVSVDESVLADHEDRDALPR